MLGLMVLKGTDFKEIDSFGIDLNDRISLALRYGIFE